jgi:hypothetical protein
VHSRNQPMPLVFWLHLVHSAWAWVLSLLLGWQDGIEECDLGGSSNNE